MNTHLERKIKKNIYGKPQSAKIFFPSGFADIAVQDVKTILATLWFPQKYTSTVNVLDNEIQIEDIHLSALTEIMLRSQAISDIHLVIYQSKTFSLSSFEKKCSEIDWGIYLNSNMSVKIKVDSVASHIFHETSLKNILSKIVSPSVKGNNEKSANTTLYAELHKNKLCLSISLAGEPLYKRGFRDLLQKSAPLREDMAFCALQKGLQFARHVKKDFIPDHLLIPFSGTGTFAFEFLQQYFGFYPVQLGRQYALQAMPFFRGESFQYLVKQAQRQQAVIPIIVNCIDISSDTIDTINATFSHITAIGFPNIIKTYNESFFEKKPRDLLQSHAKNIFMPLNPPYGLRIKNYNAESFYKNIALKINELQDSQTTIAGFILCPNEETWKAFYKNLKTAKTHTYHFNQGGLDVRVCEFICR